MYSRQNNIVFFLLLLGMVNLQFRCTKKLDCRGAVYNFELGIKAYPDKDSILVGDTLWLEVNAPTTLTDVQTGRVVDYSGAANLGTAISIAELVSVNITNSEGTASFNYFLSSGKEVVRADTSRYREYSFAEETNQYKFRLGVIPQKPGVYKMFISNAANVYRKNDNCTKANFIINFKETDQHFYFNEVSFPGTILSGKNGVYLFKVK
jgi:hypothetical protein